MNFPMLTTIPNGLLQLIKTFGDPRLPGFENEYIVEFELPYTLLYTDDKGIVSNVNKTRANKLAVGNIIQALSDVKTKGFAPHVLNFGGIYNMRNIRGSQVYLSVHAFGAAIDLEPLMYPRGSSKRFPAGVIECFSDAGFVYGGDFKYRLDPMHFQLVSGY
jgi:hypothetical protein